MSHDNWCSDCGANGGIAYGYCEECTPQEVLDAIAKRKRQIQQLVEDWGRKGAPLRDDFAEVINEWRKLWKDQKRDWTFALR